MTRRFRAAVRSRRLVACVVRRITKGLGTLPEEHLPPRQRRLREKRIVCFFLGNGGQRAVAGAEEGFSRKTENLPPDTVPQQLG